MQAVSETLLVKFRAKDTKLGFDPSRPSKRLAVQSWMCLKPK